MQSLWLIIVMCLTSSVFASEAKSVKKGQGQKRQRERASAAVIKASAPLAALSSDDSDDESEFEGQVRAGAVRQKREPDKAIRRAANLSPSFDSISRARMEAGAASAAIPATPVRARVLRSAPEATPSRGPNGRTMSLGLVEMDSDLGVKGVNGVRLYRTPMFPGEPYKVADRAEFDAVATFSPYGDPLLFKDIFRNTIVSHQGFSDHQRALVVIYNLIKNRGAFLSDYHRSVDVRADNILRRIDGNLSEQHVRFAIPRDLLSLEGAKKPNFKFFYRIYNEFDEEQLDALSTFLGEPFNWRVLVRWLAANSTVEAYDRYQEPANLDHIIPKSQGGANDLRNAAFCSRTTNLQKSDRYLNELIAHFSQLWPEGHKRKASSEPLRVVLPSQRSDMAITEADFLPLAP